VDFTVRRVRADEWRDYRTLRLEALKDSPLAFVEQHDEVLTRPDTFWRERVGNAATGTGSCTLVAVADGRLVGKASCFIEPGQTAHVVGVYVTPGWRGRGVADELIAKVVDWARDEAWAARIRLYVLDVNERAYGFYRRIGFVETGATMAYPPDSSYTEVELEYR
jgi:ribosomal protein S18 acetylase RimI-like enzyme